MTAKERGEQLAKEFIANVKNAMNKKQTEIAITAEIRETTLSKILNHKYPPNIRDVCRIVDAMGMKLAILPKETLDLRGDGDEDLTPKFLLSTNTERTRQYLTHTMYPITVLELTQTGITVIESEIDEPEDAEEELALKKVLADAVTFYSLALATRNSN